jgi:hypothetical protein
LAVNSAQKGSPLLEIVSFLYKRGAHLLKFSASYIKGGAHP